MNCRVRNWKNIQESRWRRDWTISPTCNRRWLRSPYSFVTLPTNQLKSSSNHNQTPRTVYTRAIVLWASVKRQNYRKLFTFAASCEVWISGSCTLRPYFESLTKCLYHHVGIQEKKPCSSAISNRLFCPQLSYLEAVKQGLPHWA